MGIRIREMVYHKIKLNKILSRITGKPLEQVVHQIIFPCFYISIDVQLPLCILYDFSFFFFFCVVNCRLKWTQTVIIS
jgi:hypothetical protein